MKKILLLSALLIQGLFTSNTNANQTLLPIGVSVQTDTNAIQSLFVGADRGLAGGVILDSTSAAQDISSIDSIYFEINAAPQDRISEVLTNFFNWSLWDGSTMIEITTNVALANTVFVRNMTVGSTGLDVYELQRFLNSDTNTRLAEVGRGSPGKETMYFDNATKAAVMKYQMSHGIPYTGFVGPLTRASLNSYIRPAHVILSFEGLGISIPKMIKNLSVRCGVLRLFDTNLTVTVIDSSAEVPQPPIVYPIRIDQFWLMNTDTPTNKAVAMIGSIEPYTYYDVEASTNLVNWEVVGSVTPSDSTVLKEVVAFIDSRFFERAFFRLKNPLLPKG